MHQYGLHFGFREPYQVLLDASIIKDAARYKMKLGAMLESTLHGQIKPMITQCCIRHLYDLPTSSPAEQAEKDSWIAAAKQAERRRCGHHELEEPLSALECLESVVDPKDSGRNKHRYVVASQDEDIRRKMRTIAGVPLVYMNRSVMILEPMAMATDEVRQKEEKIKMRSGLKGRGSSAGVKRKREGDDSTENIDGDAEAGAEEEPKKKKNKVKGLKGPNPLSVLKPKKKATEMKTPSRSSTKQEVHPDRKALIATSTNGEAAAKKRGRKRKPKGDNSDGGVAIGHDATAE